VTAPTIPLQPRDRGLPADEALALVQAAQAGDSDAVAKLYDAYVDFVYGYVYRRLGGNRPLAEDITSDVFLRALRALPRWAPCAGGFRAWLVTIARNLVIDHYKSAQRRATAPCGDQLGDLLTGVDRTEKTNPDALDPATITEAYLRDRELVALLRELTEEQREVLILRFWQQLSVKALQSRAVAALARKIRDVQVVLR
jgi:RNA polymerase sigma-70 factor (ECF subfamily)